MNVKEVKQDTKVFAQNTKQGQKVQKAGLGGKGESVLRF